MCRHLKSKTLIALLAGAAPLVTVATCHEAGPGGHLVINSTNDDLVDDVLEVFFGDEEEDDD